MTHFAVFINRKKKLVLMHRKNCIAAPTKIMKYVFTYQKKKI